MSIGQLGRGSCVPEQRSLDVDDSRENCRETRRNGRRREGRLGREQAGDDCAGRKLE